MFKQVVLAIMVSFTGFAILGFLGFQSRKLFVVADSTEIGPDTKLETIKGGKIRDIGLFSSGPKSCVYFVAVDPNPEFPELVAVHFLVDTKTSPDAAIAQVGDLVNTEIVPGKGRLGKTEFEFHGWAKQFTLSNREFIVLKDEKSYPTRVVWNKGEINVGEIARVGLYSATDKSSVYLVSLEVSEDNYLPFFTSSSDSAWIAFADPGDDNVMVKIIDFPKGDDKSVPWAIYFGQALN